jgi:hypothetical protein
MNVIKNYVERMKSAFVPQVDDKAKLTIDGTVVVLTNTANGKEWLGLKDGEKVAYPEDAILNDVPVYTIAKTIDQVKVGDIVKATSSTYAVVEKIEGGNIYNTTFGGNMRKNTPITDFLTQQKTVRVVVNPFGGFAGDMNNNMMMLMMLEGKESGKGDIAEIMALASMMQGNGATNPFANIMSNPMAMLMLTKNDGGSSKDFMLMMMMQNGGFMKPAAKPCEVAKPCNTDKCEADKCEDGTAPVNE